MPDTKWYGGGSPFAATITPAADDGAALGTTALQWSDLFLASGSVINFNGGDITMTHSANTLTFTGGALSLSGATDQILVTSAASTAANLSNGAQTNTGINIRTADVLFVQGGTLFAQMNSTGLGLVAGTTVRWASSTDPTTSIDTALSRSAAGVVQVNNGTAGTLRDITMRNIPAASGYLEIMEQALPAAGEKSSCRLFTVDNGAGKRSLRCIFGSGAAQVIATEP